LYQNFKLGLISPEPDVREEAVRHTGIFLKYLCDAYNDQKAYLPACDTETTYISYPAKWPEELIETMLDLTQKAGFKNVKGLDEPTAAVHTVMVLEANKLALNDDGSANMLMIDMGAGTTDLVLCRYTPYEDKKITVLNIWPKAGDPCLFGGREIDEKLCEYIRGYLIQCGFPNTKNFRDNYLDKCKTWKETNLSPTFRDKEGVVRYCGFINTLLTMLDVDAEFPPLSRDAFEDMFSGYISQFVQMIRNCLLDAQFDSENLDYVVLTGGHCQWYFTNEILDGSLTKFGRIDLAKIQNDKTRIIKLSLPQETVALGLVYQKIVIDKKADTADDIFCGYCGRKHAADDAFCPYCGKSPDGGSVTDTGAVSVPRPDTIYTLTEGKNLQGLTDAINDCLSITEGMETQRIDTGDGSILLQARAKGGKWIQWIGMDKAISVKLEKLDESSVSVVIADGKWIDKIGAMGVSLFILWPLAIAAGIGMYMQGKLPGEIKQAITRYLLS
jgi:cell division ATPase FtsA